MTNKSKDKYSGKDLAIIVPTKDRPGKISNLLNSLKNQSLCCGRIIIVDSGQDIKNIVAGFSEALPVEYYRSPVQGQIFQRNMGISMLDDSTRLVCSLDDDIVVEPEAIKSMIQFWNDCETETAGVSFNIINSPPFKHTWLKAFIGMSSPQQGRVLSSGYNVAISPVNKNIRTEWLCGGATVWKKEILNRFVNREVSSKWAICEDVIFSYPIGKKYPLYVCSDSKVGHEHVWDHTAKMKYWYYGKTATLWRLYFVESHPELSRLFFFWMISWQILIRCLKGLFSLRPQEIQYAFGQIEGSLIGMKAIYQGKNLLTILNEC
ncbi:MAG: glycosyltransferase family 2 protein [Proteobacteria bacterium]|nr:glycosyltransferase family 2 protein [Pseudomonadota bacterium]